MSDRDNQYIRAFFGVRSSSIGLALVTGLLFGGGFYVANGQEAEPQTVLRSNTSPTPMRRSENFQSNVTRTYVRADGTTRTEPAPSSRISTSTRTMTPSSSPASVNASDTTTPVVTRTFTRRVNGVVEYQGQDASDVRTIVRPSSVVTTSPVAPVAQAEIAPPATDAPVSRPYARSETTTVQPAPVIQTASIATPVAETRREPASTVSAAQSSGGYQPGYRATTSVQPVEPVPTSVRSADVARDDIRMSAQTTPVSAVTAEDLPPFETPAGTVPDGATLHQIIWSTLMVISDAQAQEDFSSFQQIISPRLRSEVAADDLPSYFEGLRSNREQLTGAIGAPADFELIPYLLPDGRLRLRGAFDVAPRDLRFDLLYANVHGVWMVDAIAFADGA